MLEFEGGVRGQVFNLEEDSIGAIIFGDYKDLKEGRRCVARARCSRCRSARPSSAAWSTRSATRSTARARSSRETTRPVDLIAPGIADRQPVKEPLQTGIKAIDSMTPIGRGQRELIIGDRKTGKTAIAIDTIINQKSENVICVYVAIGQKESTVAGIVEDLRKARRDGLHDRRRGVVVGARAPPVHRALRRLRDGRVLHVHAASATRSASTTT